jgi:hypothetical protein
MILSCEKLAECVGSLLRGTTRCRLDWQYQYKRRRVRGLSKVTAARQAALWRKSTRLSSTVRLNAT